MSKPLHNFELTNSWKWALFVTSKNQQRTRRRRSAKSALAPETVDRSCSAIGVAKRRESEPEPPLRGSHSRRKALRGSHSRRKARRVPADCNEKQNLRSQDPIQKKKRRGKSASTSGLKVYQEIASEMKFFASLSWNEIEEDFLFMTGRRPARRPTKRANEVQKTIDRLYPGSFLPESVSVVTYKFKLEEKISKKEDWY